MEQGLKDHRRCKNSPRTERSGYCAVSTDCLHSLHQSTVSQATEKTGAELTSLRGNHERKRTFMKKYMKNGCVKVNLPFKEGEQWFFFSEVATVGQC